MKAFSFHRLFLVVAIAFAATWIWAAVILWQHQRAYDEYAREVFQPELARLKRDADSSSRTLREGGKLDQVSLSAPASLDELMTRRRVLDHYWNIRENAMIGLFATFFIWAIAGQIQLGLRRKAQARLERAPAPNAGHLVGELVEQGRSFLARSKPDGTGIEIEVDGRHAVVIFRNLTFVAAFAGNKRQSAVELPFSDLLVLTTGYDKGTAFLHLRTTAGTVFWTDKVRPFDTLAALLDDIIELNRADPVAYQAARAREPVVKTPWWGWALLFACVAGIAALGWYFLSHPM